jgi:hypothetical protein
VLDIAPQIHLGAKEFFRLATVQTFDIDPDSGADIIGDLCRENPAILAGSVDLIICTEVLEHTRQPFSAVAEMYRMLTPGGCVVGTTPFNFRIHGPLPDCWRFTEHGLRELFREFSSLTIREYASADQRFLMPLQYELRAFKAIL